MPDLTQVISLYFLFLFLSIYLFVYCFKVPDYISSYYAYIKFKRKCHSHKHLNEFFLLIIILICCKKIVNKESESWFKSRLIAYFFCF